MEYSNVEEVYYQRNLVHLINENTNKIGFILLALGIIMLLIFITLINNTIRLSIYSKRFIINTMQLVGATRSFIRKPFVSKSVVQGLIGALLANIALLGVFSSFNSGFSEIVSYGTTEVTIAVFGLVFIFGALISWLSTRFAVNKFLRLRYDELFN
jgi:cell division transport system permease protein